MDRTAKIILAAIAVGLWVNAGVSVFRPVAAIAQDYELSSIRSNVSSIESDVGRIASGRCKNSKIC
jgi:hypothetical protein